MGPSLLCALFLVYLCQTQGSSAVTVFVQEGGDVRLNVTTADVSEEVLLVLWKFNKSLSIVTFAPGKEPIVSERYTGRVEFSKENFSLGLKNLRDTDSGVYTVRVTTTQKDQTFESNVIVQDPVSPVEVTVDSVNSSSDSCNLTVTCTTQDSHISSTFRCDNQTCRQEGGERSEVTTSGASLHVYLVNDSIVCNHSNQVSWTEDTEMVHPLCVQHVEPPTPDNNVIVYVLVSITVFVIIIIGAGFLCHRKRGEYKRDNTENTIYATPQLEATAQPQDQSPTNDASGLSPTSTYCLVGPHIGPMGSTKTKGNTLPESLYAQVERPAKS